MENVLHLISSNGFYGAENVLLEICLGLRKSREFHPFIGILDNGNGGHRPLLNQCQNHNLDWIVLDGPGTFNRSLPGKLKAAIKKNNIRILHSHGYKSNFYAFLARHSASAIVSTCHNWIPSDLKIRFFTWLDKALLRAFDQVVSVSRPVEHELKKWRIKTQRLSLIYNGIDIDRFKRNAERRKTVRKQLGVGDSETVVGFVGRITQEKGIDALVMCAETIHASHPDVRFLLVGDGSMLAGLKGRAKKHIICAGNQSDMPSYYAAFDIFALPSLTEGLPMVILEAMASGLPVVASNVGAIGEVMVDKETGFLIRPGYWRDLKISLETLIKAPSLAHKMGEKGKNRVEQLFAADIMVDKYARLYHRLLQTASSKCLPASDRPSRLIKENDS